MAIQSIAWGPRLNMIAEVSAFDPTTIGVKARECAYLVTPVGDETYDTEWFITKTAAREYVRYVAKELSAKIWTV